eukprot:336338-Rhodomonas_salina.2
MRDARRKASAQRDFDNVLHYKIPDAYAARCRVFAVEPSQACSPRLTQNLFGCHCVTEGATRLPKRSTDAVCPGGPGAERKTIWAWTGSVPY